MRISIVTIICLYAALWAVPVFAQTGAESAVRGHFERIEAKDYTGADSYFSEAFRKAFKGDVRKLNRYYLARLEQLGRGYEILAIDSLNDAEHETARVTIEFGPKYPEANFLVTERMYYYLIREKDNEGPLRTANDMAWRIDIFDSISFDSLADARRRPYLFTNEAWSEDEGRELKSRAGMFMIQVALEQFYEENGQYPFRLLGKDNRRDELIQDDFLDEQYPVSGFANRSMDSLEFGIKSSGDFSYYSLDTTGDGLRDAYYLLLKGKVPKHYYYVGFDTVYILSSYDDRTQRGLARRFAEYWTARTNEEVLVANADWPDEHDLFYAMQEGDLPVSSIEPVEVLTSEMQEVMPEVGSEIANDITQLASEGIEPNQAAMEYVARPPAPQTAELPIQEEAEAGASIDIEVMDGGEPALVNVPVIDNGTVDATDVMARGSVENARGWAEALAGMVGDGLGKLDLEGGPQITVSAPKDWESLTVYSYGF